MTTATLGVPATVSDELISEIDSIKADSTDGTVEYQPQAWSREGLTD